MHRLRTPALVSAAYLGTFLATLDISIVNVALPTLQTALHADVADLQWVINAYAIALSTLMLSAGPMGDRHGHKRIWLFSVLLFVAGSVACALATGIAPLLCGRAIQGIAGALLIPAAMPILTHAFSEPRQRARAIGGWSACSALALVSGPLLGGLLVEHLGWQSIFLVNLPLGLLAAALGLWAMPERKHPQHAAADPWGQGLCMLGLGLLSYGLIQLGQTAQGSTHWLWPIAISAALLAAFIRLEWRVQRPVLPVRLFQLRHFAIANMASFALGFSGYASLFFLSIFLQQAQPLSPAAAGMRLAPQFVMTAVTSLLFSRLVHRYALHALMITGYLLVGLAMVWMTGFHTQTTAVVEIACLLLLGMGMGLAVPATGMTVMNAAPPEQAGIASATMNALRQTGMSLGIALLGSLMSRQAIRQLSQTLQLAGLPQADSQARAAITHHQLPSALIAVSYRTAMASGFVLAMAVAGLLCLIAATILWWNRQHAR